MTEIGNIEEKRPPGHDEEEEDINARLERMLGESPQPVLSPEQEKEPKHRIVAPKFSVMKARAMSPNNSHMS